MHNLSGVADRAPEGVPDALMPKAHAERRDCLSEVADDIVRDAGLLRCARSGRYDYLLGGHRVDVLDGGLVVTLDVNVRAKLGEVLVQVVGEAVVVVYE